jgi:putative phage-type endonuclease
MPKILIEDTSDRQAWLKARTKGVGASDIATIMGINPYKTPLELWAEKTGKIERSTEMSDAAFMGLELEDDLLRLFTRKTGIDCFEDQKLYQHDEDEIALCTPDGYYMEGELRVPLQLKTSTENSKKWKEEGLPLWVVCQVMWEMYVLDAPKSVVFPYLAGNAAKAEPIELEYEHDFLTACKSQVDQFWKLIVEDRQPEATENDVRTLHRIYDQLDGAKTASDEIVMALKRMQSYKEMRDSLQYELYKAESLMKKEQAAIAQFLGDSKALEVGGEVVLTQTKVVVPERVQKSYDYQRISPRWKKISNALAVVA